MTYDSPLLNKKVKDLTIEDKQSLTAADFICVIERNILSGDYALLHALVTGEGCGQLTLDNPEGIEQEFTETFSEIPDDEELTVEQLLEVNDKEEITDYIY
jgi:hypothetical protein